VNASATATLPSAGPGRAAAFVALLLIGTVATVAATIYGNGNLVIAAAPVVLAIALGVLSFAPIRIPLLILIFLSLAIDAKDEGPMNSALAPIGSLLHVNLNKSIPVGALAVPGIVLVLAFLLVIHIHRSIWGVRTDTAGRSLTAGVLLQSLGVSLFAVIALCAFGFKNGGDLQMAKIQVQTFVLILLVAYLSAMSLRGLGDYRVLGRLVVAAASVKALWALWVAQTIQPPYELSNGKLAYATTHGDSLLFATATVLLIVRFAEQPIRRNGMLCLVLLPLLWAGMVANNRRLVWVEIAAALLTFWLISRRSKVKRFVVHATLAAVPLIVGYVAVGWNSQSKVFAPVKIFRSVGDSEVDASTLYRDLENYNLLATVKVNPFTGTGFGHPFAEIVKLPDISFFKEYRYMPHNSVLGLWAFCGPFGFSGLVFALVVAMYLSARSYQRAANADQRVAAYMSLAVVLLYMIHCWGDIGFSERKTIVLVGPALAMAGQLAMMTGAWRFRVAK
jgi:O-Antigen ligase